MSNHKPLPTLPIDRNVTTLSVEAQHHRSRLIRHILSEVQEPAIENKRESWACILEDVLDDLSLNIARGDWLHGVKRRREATREVRKKRCVVEQPKQAEEGKKVVASVNHFCEAIPQETSTSSTSHRHQDIGLTLKEMQELASKPTSNNSSNHLLLCLAPLGSRAALPTEDTGFSLIPASIGCVFSPGIFLLPDAELNATSEVLYGLAEWQTVQDDMSRLVGGTFTFKGINSPLQRHILSKALRISIYIHVSLILEQHFLMDSNVRLQFPSPEPTSPPPPVSGRPMLNHSDSADSKPKNRNFLSHSGIFSFFSKKSMGHRSSTISPIIGREGSLDLTSLIPGGWHGDSSPRASADRSDSPSRRFSFRADRRSSFVKPTQEADLPFLSTLKRIRDSSDLLSTSIGVTFAPPTLVVDLAEKEEKKPSRRVKGDERVGLSSLMGWEGKKARGKGMSGIVGFIRLQEFSVLFSRHVPSSPTSDVLSSTSSSVVSQSLFSPCDRPRLITYRYYSNDPAEDKRLGETILDLIANASLPCERPECSMLRGKHELRLIHGGLRICISTEDCIEERTDNDDDINVWESCAICGAKTKRATMSTGSYLYSFAKFLELLVYSPSLCTLTPPLCEHTTPPAFPWPVLPPSRLNIIRCFSSRGCMVSFSLSVISDIFELRVPRLQITRHSGDTSGQTTSPASAYKTPDVNGDEEKRILRREIKRWWECVADHLDRLDAVLGGNDVKAFHKALPRLPSSDDSYDDSVPLKAPEPTPILSMILARNGMNPPPGINEEYFSTTPNGTDAFPSLPEGILAPVSKAQEPLHLLYSLRHTFHRTEQSLYQQLSRTPISSLNDVRRSFLSAARGAHRRLLAWQKKHMPSALKAKFTEEMIVEEPEWWSKGCHAVPGGNIIVREDDWGSIIAFTMSTADYQRELTNMSVARAATSPPVAPALSPRPTNPSSLFSAAAGYSLFTLSGHSQPDPDQEGVIWHEPETFSAVVSRKEHPRDPTSMLSIREVLRQRAYADSTSGLPASRFMNIGSSTSRPATATPPLAWAKPDVQINMQAADGEVSGLPDTGESAGKILQDIDLITAESRPSSVISEDLTTGSSEFVDAHIRRGKASSLISGESDMTIGRGNVSDAQLSMASPPLPPKDEPQAQMQWDMSEPQPVAEPKSPPSTFTSTITNSLNVAMRFMRNPAETSRPASPFPKTHHGLLLADTSTIDDRPHIKYDWTIGKRLKFSCTVYYAKQFDVLRKRCGIEDVFLKSLSRSANWIAEGGKSKSNFWKTADDQFIIKTLVDAWNVADLQVLIELAPSYFRYMDATASKATVLAKLVGFYTIEIRNLETGAVQSKVDLLVMENLFYKQKIVKTFDLKGIQGRKVKPSVANPTQNQKTLFDGEWIEGQQRTLMLVQPHSKSILRDAIRNDADFLSKSNIMDYSLLLGIDDEKKQIACGLVDTIGSYTFAKTLEYKAKQGLQSGKEVTVMPPAEYQDRFISALEGYFLACPDKWTKPLDERRIISDPNSLPSVL